MITRTLPAAATKLPPIGRLPASTSLNLVIGLPLRNQAGLTELLRRIYDPASPAFRQYLTPQKFTEAFSPTEEDYAAAIAFAKASRLIVTGTHPNRTLLEVRGNVADIEKAFGVNLRLYRHPAERRTFYAPDADPSLDVAFLVLSIGGLDNYVVPHPKSLRPFSGRPSSEVTPKGGSGPGGAFMGNDFRAAYAPDVSLTGAGQAVGLLEFYGYYLNDITNYEGAAGLTNVTVTNVLLQGYNGVPDGNSLAVAEVSMDIETAVAMAPGLSQVIVYEVNPSSTYADVGLNQMATDNLAKQLSSSWDFGIDANSELIFQQFAAQGQSFFNASGDVTAYTNGIPSPDDDPYITIVGGTALTTTSEGGWSSETTWNQGGGVGSSGGISSSYPIPYWQQTVNMATNLGSTTMRNIPDVALTAENVEVIYNNGATNAYSGTSCAAPLWAGFMTLVNEQAANSGMPPAGFINPAIYWLGGRTNYASCFHDITTGNNTNANSHNLFHAVPGYDLCTGWGTPAGSNLIVALATPEPLQVQANANFASSGPVGGPFTPTGGSINITNVGAASLTWTLVTTLPWLTFTSSGGTLAPGAVTNILLSLNSAANSLPIGSFTNTLTFSNLADGFFQVRQFSLQVRQSIVQNGGFETGDLSGWTVSGAGGVGVSPGKAYVWTGNYGASLGPAGSLGYLSQTVPTATGQAYLLALWLDSPDGLIPNEFSVAWNETTLFDQTNLGKIGWTNLQFIVTAAGPSSVLQFGFRDDQSYLGLDDISLAPIPTPSFQSVTQVGGALSLSWSASAGLTYQLQYATNLAQAQWLSLGNPVVSTNETAVVSTSIGPDEARFYRVLLLP
ncbi:MAG: protease pro-enzyme activation domain-containing protein [Verrucomicrobiota bacterium]